MSSIIQLLPDHVANQIAAGEVVQRPASVVKELVENAVDAGATMIQLIVKDAGKTLIQVIDNGKGMSDADAKLCFERHATSKIRQAEDLFSLHTKGFRGEALASIAAIAHVELKTRQEHEELGTHLIIEGSKFVSQDVAVLPKGTSFLVKNLFFNIPARRNFLKSDTVEFRHIVDDFERVALAHPNIHFILMHNGSEMFNLPSSNTRQRIVNVFGGKTNEKLVPISESTEIVEIQGFVGKPEFSKKSRNEQFFFVNNRFIKSPYLHHAIMAAFEGLLKDGNQPSYFLFLDVPPHSIDINIHPTKTEIKFDDEQAMYAILRSAVKHSLGQFNVAPILDFERDSALDIPYDYKDKESETPLIQVDTNFNPFAEEKPSKSFSSSSGGSYSFGGSYKKQESSASWESLYVGLSSAADEVDVNEIQFESEEVTGSLFEESTTEISSNKTYQIQKKYIVSPIKSGLLLIHQERAHQRVLYEQFFVNITVQEAASQQLLFPLELHFTPSEMMILKELKESLEKTGFVFSAMTTEIAMMTGLPVNLSDKEVQALLEELINNFNESIPDSGFSQTDKIAQTMCKNLAVKTGNYLSEKEQEGIVNSLFACKEPNVSPFNKPTFVTIGMEDLDKLFAL
ncbi:DNA mismatch repair endonuclease MutL [Flavobacterium sp.]|uniref:DNA mismatch repair endonuclease MutL n=1 Tax=Flavobacterium sp. TaxID=239 RepID=UPI0028BD7CF4|nr:DNA mismatch repair endonuclease MutL [Flavobacterium sp.]